MRHAVALSLALLSGAFMLELPSNAVAASALPPIVSARIEQDQKACGAEPAIIEPGFVTQKDVNGDGIPDYILNYAHLKCGSVHGFCGSGGCTIAVFASRNGKFINVIDDLVGRIDFKNIKGRPAAVMVYPGSACGKDPCTETRYWSGSTFKAAR